MQRQTVVECGLFVVLVAFGVLVRVSLEHLPNFAPVAALALFAGYFFRSWIAAVLVPVGVMTISDYFIGGYNWQMMALVYAMLAFPVALRGPLRKHLRLKRGSLLDLLRPVAGLVACGLGSSILFFLATNLGVLLWSDMYERSFAGLLHCYAQAAPFFRYTLTGDLCFAFLLFGGYGLAVYANLAAPPVVAPVSTGRLGLLAR